MSLAQGYGAAIKKHGMVHPVHHAVFLYLFAKIGGYLLQHLPDGKVVGAAALAGTAADTGGGLYAQTVVAIPCPVGQAIPKTRLSVLSQMQIKGLKRHTRHTKQKPIIQKFIKNTR